MGLDVAVMVVTVDMVRLMRSPHLVSKGQRMAGVGAEGRGFGPVLDGSLLLLWYVVEMRMYVNNMVGWGKGRVGGQTQVRW